MLSSEDKKHFETFLTDLFRDYAFRRRDEDQQKIISSSNPITLDYAERRYVYIYSPVALTISVQDYGNITLPANSWVPLPFPERTRLFATGQSSDQLVFLRQTDDEIPYASTVTQLAAGAATIGNVGLNAGTNTVGNVGSLGLPVGATQINANGTNTAGTATATLTGAAGKFTYLTSMIITIIDTATAGSAELSLSGVANGPLLFEVNAQGTVGVEAPIIIPFPTPIQSSAVNTNIVATLPSLGASTGKVSIVLVGYLL